MTHLVDVLHRPPVKPDSASPRGSVLAREEPARQSAPTARRAGTGARVVLASALGASLIWSYWPVLSEMAARWARDPRYSHGFLVPVFASYLLWSRRSERPSTAASNWLALTLFGAAAALRLVGGFFFVSWLDAVSILVSLAGLCFSLGGWSMLRWAWPSIAFLIFMVPLPYRFEESLGIPLQRFATESSSFFLQIFGVPAFSSGNTIVIDDFQIGVIDACNGLGMSYMFLACSLGAALMMRSSLLDGAILVASAVPIGLAANIARIVATGLLHRTVGRWIADAVYHDLAGWLMMLMALFILWLECKLLPHLFIETTHQDRVPATANEDGQESNEDILTRPDRPRVIPGLAAMLIVLATGVVTGLWANRWAASHELNRAAARLVDVPMAIGDWKARPEQVDPRGMIAAEIEDCVVRRYEDRRTGKKIGLVLVCGRPGPVAVHTPNICYPAAGYQMTQTQPNTVVVEPGSGYAPAEFLSAWFMRDRSVVSEGLRIFWSWNATGRWTVPQSARLEFAGRPFLYKLYVISATADGQEKTADAWETEFIRQLLPDLAKTLFPVRGELSERTSTTGAGVDQVR
jgi:exosortase